MRDRLAGLERDFTELEGQLADPALIADSKRYAAEGRRYHQLAVIVATYRQLLAREADAEAARELLKQSEGEDRTLFRTEADEADADVARLTEDLRLLLLPRDPNDDRNVVMEIRGAEGGEEANLFARDLFEMYQGYIARQGWKLQITSSSASPMGGYNEIVFRVIGDGAWSKLKWEAGPHRVQRVPVTEAQGRIHTSSATVTVLPEVDDIDEVDFQIDPGDVDVDVYRSSGAGGQHVNTTDSAVRMTHRPSGIVVTMQDERSQLQNRAKAMELLRTRLWQLEQAQLATERSGLRQAQIGGGGRSEKIRTYNYKENRVTDHRLKGLTLYKLDRILTGELDDVIDPLVQHERAEALSNGE